MALQIQNRRGLSAIWTVLNPVLAAGEIGAELDTNQAKIGNGIDAWNDLPYWPTAPAPISAGVAVADDINGLLDGGSPFPRLNFHGKGVLATGYIHSDQIDISIPGLAFWDENTPIGGTPHTVLNFVGNGVTVVDNGAGKATVLVPGTGPKAVACHVGGTGTYPSSTVIPPGAVITRVTLKIVAPYTAANQLRCNFNSTGVMLMDASENNPMLVGINQTHPFEIAPANTVIQFAVFGAYTQGEAEFYVEYVETVS